MTRLVSDLDGPGSRESITEYIKTVLEQRTDVHGDTDAEKLARAITTSVLARLGIEPPTEREDH